MRRDQSAIEEERQHLRAFGSELGALYHALEHEVIWLHAKWLEYRKLYAKSDKRIDLLNKTAGFFFRVVQDALWGDLLLHIARLTDPPKQGRYENLTLLRLPEAVHDKGLADNIRDLVKTALANAEFAREWRNRSLAHQELSLALQVGAKPLPGASRKSVEDVLASYRKIMNRLHVSYLQGEVGYEYFLAYDDADMLVRRLAVAARLDERQKERLRQGKPLPEDLEPPPEA